MINVDEIVYLLDMSGRPLRALHDDRDLQVEHVDGSKSILSVSLPFDDDILTDMQIIFRGERYIISDIEDNRDAGLTMNLVAEIAYMRLSGVYSEIDSQDSTILAIARTALSDTRWTMGSVDSGGGRHSMTFEDRDSSVLATLRLLERWSDGAVKLQFDTINYVVNYVSVDTLDAGFLFKYGKNVESIKRERFAPEATVLVPTGNDDLNISSVTEGNVNFVENYGYYLEQGYTLEEARKNFEKIGVFKDERYHIPGNLMREAERRLEVLAYPQIAYSTEISHVDKSVKSGMTGYVQDDDLGIKVHARVVRIVEFRDTDRSEIELNYLIPGIGDLQEYDSGSSGGVKSVSEQLDTEFNSNSERYDVMFQASVSNIASTHLGVGFWFHSEATTQGTLLDGYFDIDGVRTGHIVKQTLTGYDMHGYPFKIPSVQEGSHIIRFMAKSEGGTFTVPAMLGELFVESDALAGGMSSRAPVINWTEEVEFPPYMYVEDDVRIELFDTTINVSEVTVRPNESELYVGDTVKLTATVAPGDATDKAVTWTINNENIATIDNNGLVTAVGIGPTTVTATAHNGTYDTAVIQVVEPDVEEPVEPGELVPLVPVMTSNTTPAPYVASASSYSGRMPYMAFNGIIGSNGDEWMAEIPNKSGWLAIDLGTTYTVKMFEISSTLSSQRNPGVFALEASSNDQDWIQLHDEVFDVTGEWLDGEIKEFNVDNDIAYRYYRLRIDMNNGNPIYTTVNNMQLYGY